GREPKGVSKRPLPSHAHLFAEEFPLDQRQDQYDAKEEEGDGRGIAHLEILKGLVVQVEHHRQRGVQGPSVSAGDHVHLVEDLEGPDDGHHHDKEGGDRKSTRLNSSHVKISYAVFCLKKKK